MKILQKEEQHSTLAMTYNEITRHRQNIAISISIYANSQVYHGTFLPKTSRDTRGSI